MKEAIQPEGLARPAAPYSPVVVSGDLVFTAGQVGFDESGQLTADDITGQSRQAFENLRACLRAAGCELGGRDQGERVPHRPRQLPGLQRGLPRVSSRSRIPARSTVGVSLPAGILVEVEAVARVATT